MLAPLAPLAPLARAEGAANDASTRLAGVDDMLDATLDVSALVVRHGHAGGARHRTHASRPRPLEAQLQSVSRGDMKAFDQLYEHMAPRIYGLARRVLKDTHQAEEVTQEVFLQIWQTASRFDPNRGSGLAWLMMIAHRRAVDRVRSSETRRRRDALDAQRSQMTPHDATAEAALASLDAQSVRAALFLLSPIQRQALELAYFEGYTCREISWLLQIPGCTAKTRVRDALIRLRVTMLAVA